MVPAGARISAGNSGSVDRSLPNRALTDGEPVAGELHAVAGVAGEAHHHPVQGLRRRREVLCRSFATLPQVLYASS